MTGPAPRSLWVACWVLVPLVFGFLAWDLFVLYPGYAFGDEGIQVSRLDQAAQGGGLAFAWAQGSLHRALLYGWAGLSGWRLGLLHGLGYLILAVEAALLFRLTRRWIGEEAALWAVLALLLASATWLRARSVLSFQLLPLELLLLGLLAGRVRGRAGALAWGLAAGALSLDYEGALIAAPLLYWACLRLEPGFGSQARWSAAGGGVALLAVWLSSPQTLSSYATLRGSVSIGFDALHWIAVAARNLGQIFSGGEPLPYLGISDWPAIPFWLWPGLGLGAWLARSAGLGRLLLWAGVALLATQASLAPYGVPGHRLVAAWPALLMIAGLGLAHLRVQSGRLWPGLAVGLAFLAALEVHGYVVHQLRNGGSAFQASQALDQAVEQAARLNRDQGAGFSTRLYDWRFPVLGFHRRSRDLEPAKPDGPLLVLLPPEYRLAAQGLGGRLEVIRLSKAQSPVLVLHCQGRLARRFRDVEEVLARVGAGAETGPAAYQRIVAWLAAHPQADPFVWSSLMHSAAWLCFSLGRLDGREVWELYLRRPVNNPGVATTLARYFMGRSPEAALRLSRDAKRLDPLFLPAFAAEEEALKRLERRDEAAAVRVRARELYSQGAWFIPD